MISSDDSTKNRMVAPIRFPECEDGKRASVTHLQSQHSLLQSQGAAIWGRRQEKQRVPPAMEDRHGYADEPTPTPRKALHLPPVDHRQGTEDHEAQWQNVLFLGQ